MGSPGEKLPWQATLLAASILSSCFLLSQGQNGTILVTVEPPMPKKGASVVLKPGTLPESVIACRWHRGVAPADGNLIRVRYLVVPGNPTGPAYTGRETVDASCSLHITNLNTADSGNYTLKTDEPLGFSTGIATFEVIDTPGGGGPHLSGGAIAGIVIGCVAGVILIAGLLYFLCTKTSRGRTEHHISNGNIPSAPGHNQGVTDTKPRSGEEDVQYSTLAFNGNNPPQPTPGAAPPSDGTIIYSEIKKK